MLFKWLQSELPWTPETLHCSHFCDFDASLLSLFFVFFSRSEKALILEHFGQGPAAGGGAPLSFRFCRFCKKYSARPAPLKGCGEYMKGFAPCRRPLNSGFDHRTIRCFDGLLIADHLYPIGGSRACLLRSILAAGDGFGCHLGGLGDILGMGWVPDWPGDARKGRIVFPSGREHCSTEIQGSRQRPKLRVIC